MRNSPPSFEQTLKAFKTREPSLVATHLAREATAEIANSLGLDPLVLAQSELTKLFIKYAARKGFTAAFELGWHWSATNEDELRDWQMAYLEQVGDDLGNCDWFLSGISRNNLGYRFRIK